MNYQIYVHGCETCGEKVIYLTRFKRWAAANGHTTTTINSKHDEAARKIHARLSKKIKQDEYASIVVDEYGHTNRLESRAWIIYS